MAPEKAQRPSLTEYIRIIASIYLRSTDVMTVKGCKTIALKHPSIVGGQAIIRENSKGQVRIDFINPDTGKWGVFHMPQGDVRASETIAAVKVFDYLPEEQERWMEGHTYACVGGFTASKQTAGSLYAEHMLPILENGSSDVSLTATSIEIASGSFELKRMYD